MRLYELQLAALLADLALRLGELEMAVDDMQHCRGACEEGFDDGRLGRRELREGRPIGSGNVFPVALIATMRGTKMD